MAAKKLLLTVLCFSAVLCLVHANKRAQHSQKIITPLSCGVSVNDVPTSCDTNLQQVFKLLLVDNDTDRVYIGSTECLYVLDRNLIYINSTKLSLTGSDLVTCEAFFAQEKEFRCKNYITYAHKVDETSVRVCGTYGSLNPRCYTCQSDGTGCDDGYTTQFMQRTPTENVTVTVTNTTDGSQDYYYLGGLKSYTSPDKILAKVVVNLAGDVSTADPETDNNQENIFKEPTNFVGSIERGAFIYFFYRETAIEYKTMGQIIYSRVARVCKNDTGGVTNPLSDEFTTFLKTRLMCSVGTDFPFIFNEIQDVVQSNDINFIYGLFTTSSAGSSSTAICRYNMDEIDELFNEDDRRGQLSSTTLWQSVPRETEDTSARRSCSTPFRFQEYNYLEEYTLLNTNAPNCGLGTVCNVYSRQTDEALAVFEGIRGQQLTVFSDSSDPIQVYVGTNDNTIYGANISASEVLITRQMEIEVDVDSVTETQIANKWPFGVSYLKANEGVIYGTVDNCAFRFNHTDDIDLKILDRSPDVSKFTFPTKITDATIQIFKLFEGPDGSNIQAHFSGGLENRCNQQLLKSTGAGKREFLHVLCEINNLSENITDGVITVSSPMISDLNVAIIVVQDNSDEANCNEGDVNDYDKQMAIYKYDFRKWLSNSVTCSDGSKNTCPAASSPGS